ncbi:MAG: radical SAM protein, partial [Thermoplasmata archaeon]
MKVGNLIKLTKIFLNYKLKRDTLSYLPIRLWIEPTSHCNLKCIMCLNKDLPPGKKGYMDFEVFKKIIDEVKGHTHDISIHHRGESLLHPKLPDMIRYATESGVYVKLHTNATLLSEKKSIELIESGLNLLSFSFDGYGKEEYEKIRIGANFEKTLENIKNFIKIREDLGR